jgi:N-acetylmuramoyl-L-alanine amidase
MARFVNKIIIHCSATPEGKDFTVADIDKWHKARGWQGIGYHYVIYRDGSIHAGRPEDKVGAHTSGHNANSIGVCYIGGYAINGKTPKDTRTNEQKVALRELVANLKAKHPNATVHGHYEFSPKACPSFKIEDL